MDAITVEDLHKHYGHVHALRGLNLSVRQGEIFGLLGANGAGKTTLIKLLVGITHATSGTIRVLGCDPISQARQVRRQVGYMPQLPALYEDLSPRENLAFFGRAHRLPNLQARIDEVLEFTRLLERQHDPVYGFSGGMKQRVSLACALIHQPRLLLLDEPTAGIDPRLREAFWGHFRRLAAQGVTLLVSTHQMDEVLHCDRAAVMRDGVLLACDTPSGLLARGRTTITIWRDQQPPQQEIVPNYAEHLPRLLGLPDIAKIEIQQDTLEAIVLGLISPEEASDA